MQIPVNKNATKEARELLQYLEEVSGKKWVGEIHSSYASRYHYPWDMIDDSRIKAEGFSTNKLKFDIDHKNILNLLEKNQKYNILNIKQGFRKINIKIETI